MKKNLILMMTLIISIAVLTGCGSNSSSGNGSNGGSENGGSGNQSVYKTIDFNSYKGDVNSTEFDDLVNKKVTFYNVPTLSGYLGSLVKGFSCTNESSLTIEDDKTYTLTGVVTSTRGTYSVRMKDCTLTEN